ncbi:MAG: SDR family NAD(P)-dependent oxidoreductase, partial [bacterium]
MKELFDLSGKTALITGSSQGLGFTLARGLGQAGAAIVLNGRNKQKLEKAVVFLKREGLNVCGSAFDVREEKEIQKQLKTIEKEIGEIDILINNAGIQIRAPLEQFEEKKWRQILDINLTGVFLTSKIIVQGMIK